MTIGVDLGNLSRTSLAILDGTTLLDWCFFNRNESETTLEHRAKIVNQIYLYINKYQLTPKDTLVFEQIHINMGKSRLANITSMAFLQATIINEFSDKIAIYEVHVQSWKCRVLGGRGATKDDAVAFVEKNYPQVDLSFIEHHKRKGDIVKKDNDTADAICIGLYPVYADKKWWEKNKVNYT